MVFLDGKYCQKYQLVQVQFRILKSVGLRKLIPLGAKTVTLQSKREESLPKIGGFHLTSKEKCGKLEF